MREHFKKTMGTLNFLVSKRAEFVSEKVAPFRGIGDPLAQGLIELWA
jgi:hypothetical protein